MNACLFLTKFGNKGSLIFKVGYGFCAEMEFILV